MYRAIVVTTPNLEALYIDGELVLDGQSLELDWLFWVKTFDFHNVSFKEICPHKVQLPPEDILRILINGFSKKLDYDYTTTSV